MTACNDPSHLRFFGTVTASVSHELKNVLAIVNENAGLIEDVLAMAAKGRDPDPARLLKAVQAIQAQIRRGDTIIKGLNRFAHSVDEPRAAMVVDQALELAVGLTARMAAMRGVNVTFAPSADSIMVKSAPFAFQQLMWHCLDGATAGAADRAMGVDIRVESAASGAVIRIKGGAGVQVLADSQGQALLAAAGATAAVDAATGEVAITLNPIDG